METHYSAKEMLSAMKKYVKYMKSHPQSLRSSPRKKQLPAAKPLNVMIDVLHLSEKGGVEHLSIAPKEIVDMYTGSKWLNSRIIDAYLLYLLVMPDLDRYKKKHTVR